MFHPMAEYGTTSTPIGSSTDRKVTDSGKEMRRDAIFRTQNRWLNVMLSLQLKLPRTHCQSKKSRSRTLLFDSSEADSRPESSRRVEFSLTSQIFETSDRLSRAERRALENATQGKVLKIL
jgi:hypothetical protein